MSDGEVEVAGVDGHVTQADTRLVAERRVCCDGQSLKDSSLYRTVHRCITMTAVAQRVRLFPISVTSINGMR